MFDFISTRGGATLWLSVMTGPGSCFSQSTLLDDAVGLAHSSHAHEVAVVGVAVDADRDVEVHPVVGIVGLLLAQVPGDARTRAASAR